MFQHMFSAMHGDGCLSKAWSPPHLIAAIVGAASGMLLGFTNIERCTKERFTEVSEMDDMLVLAKNVSSWSCSLLAPAVALVDAW